MLSSENRPVLMFYPQILAVIHSFTPLIHSLGKTGRTRIGDPLPSEKEKTAKFLHNRPEFFHRKGLSFPQIFATYPQREGEFC